MEFGSGLACAGGPGTELWRDCVDWLIRCGVIDKSHRVTLGSAALLDFAQMLRDGVILCQLAHRLAPAALDMRAVNLRPQLSQFLCLKNICVFIRSCQSYFELPQSELFEAWQLYKVADFAKVLLTLSRLSHSKAARKSGVAGFPELAEEESSAQDYYNLHDDIYRSLADQAESKELEQEEPYRAMGVEEEEYGKIYDVIVTRHPDGVTRKPSARTVDDWSPVERRDHVIKELLDTEKNYVEALNMMLRKFFTPLRPVLSSGDHQAIFMNLQELANIHTAFYSELSRAGRNSVVGSPTASTSNAPNLGQVFLRWKTKLVAYSEYCAKLPGAQGRVESLCEASAATRAKIVECQADANENRFRLQDLLSVPMQRVLKYHLILRELDKATTAEHPEKISIAAALDAMLDLSLYINEVKGDSEMLKLVRDIQGSIADLVMPENTDLKDYGRLLKDGEVRLCSHEDRKVKSRYVFIFDKVLMVCKNVKGNQYTYKSAVILGDFRLERPEAEGARGLGTLIKGAKAGQTFSLVHKGGENVLQLHFKSRELAESWAGAVAMAHDNVCPLGATESEHGWQYATVPSATECGACGKLLRGLFYQGYRCQLGQSYRAIKSFTGNNGGSDFLEFRENDVIQILAVDTGTDGWWRGRIVAGPQKDRTGLFPADAVRKQNRIDRTGTWHVGDTAAASPVLTTPTVPDSGLLFPLSSAPSSPSPTGYVNMDDLASYHWYCGPLERQLAEERLSGLPDGTFLVRYSEKAGGHAISVAFEGEAKHVKVESGPGGFFLDEGPTPFASIVDLVRYYGEHNMHESFQALDTTLAHPFKSAVLSVAKALHNFEPTSQSMVGLRRGQEVLVLSKNGDERGWWKGKVAGRVGYFPLAYVRETEAAAAATESS